MERIRFSRDAEAYRVHLPLPGATVENLDVVKVEDELIVRAGSVRRSLKLPRRIAPLKLECALFEDGELEVVFLREAKGAPPVWEA
jgi:arsenite-transporting ATPase